MIIERKYVSVKTAQLLKEHSFNVKVKNNYVEWIL